MPSLGPHARDIGLGLVLLGSCLIGATAAAQPLRAESAPVIVSQSTDYSCGAAALATVLNLLGSQRITEAQVLERLVSVGASGSRAREQGFSLADLARAAASWGYSPSGLRISLAELPRLSLPAIVRLQTNAGGHFSVLMAVDDAGGQVQLADPSWGVVSMTLPQFAALWLDHSVRGVVLRVAPPVPGATRVVHNSE